MNVNDKGTQNGIQYICFDCGEKFRAYSTKFVFNHREPKCPKCKGFNRRATNHENVVEKLIDDVIDLNNKLDMLHDVVKIETFHQLEKYANEIVKNCITEQLENFQKNINEILEQHNEKHQNQILRLNNSLIKNGVFSK